MTTSPENLTTAQALEKVAIAVTEGQLSKPAGENLKRWLTEPAYERYGDTLRTEIAQGRFAQLDLAFWEVIPFGTGGRRGAMGEYGSATINDRTIAESAHGLAVYLHEAKGTSSGKAVIARDTRNRSEDFAKLTATTLAANGLEVFFFAEPRSTPELSFAVRHLECDVGVMISASHNPPEDNGFKAYWSNGAQVLSPHDKGIINCVYQAGVIPSLDFDKAVQQGRIHIAGAEIDAAYVKSVLAVGLASAREMPAIFTPLHGVGETNVFAVLEAAGFSGVTIFEPQRKRDGDFPEVPDHLPNPERTAVFRPAIEAAKKSGAELILASDPDADRLGVCVRDRDGAFVHLTGNRIAALLTDHVLRKRQADGSLTPAHYVVETLVTTPLVSAIARANGVRAIDDLLVGFKYIAQTMDREGPELFVFGAEESLGYLAGDTARDKDAAVAGLFLMEAAAELRANGKTLLDRLDELYVEHGYFLESQTSEVCQGPRGKELFEHLLRCFREQPPLELAGITFAQARDYGRHEIRSLPTNQHASALPEPQGDLVIFDSVAGSQEIKLAVRPSGTEPKIKFYFFARADVPSADQLAEVKANTDAKLSEATQALGLWIQEKLKGHA